MDAPVLIIGETGTGKELVARAIHRNSPAPRLASSCPSTAAPSSAAPHRVRAVRPREGAFTGAPRQRSGLFERRAAAPSSSTRSARCPRDCRCACCACSRTGEVRRSAPARDPSRRARDRRHQPGPRARDARGELPPGPLLSPPRLRDPRPAPARAPRGHPPPGLALPRQASRAAAARPSLTPGALGALAGRDWPGNVRELENTLERLAVEARGGTIDVADLPPAFREQTAPLEEPLFTGLPSLEEMEKRYLRHVLTEVSGNRSRAAQDAGRRPPHALPDGGALRPEPRRRRARLSE